MSHITDLDITGFTLRKVPVDDLVKDDLFFYNSNRGYVFRHQYLRAGNHHVAAASINGSDLWTGKMTSEIIDKNHEVFLLEEDKPVEPEFLIEQKFLCHSFDDDDFDSSRQMDEAVGEFITKKAQEDYELISMTRSDFHISVLMVFYDKIPL